MIALPNQPATRSAGIPNRRHFHEVPSAKHQVCAVNTDGTPAARAASRPMTPAFEVWLWTTSGFSRLDQLRDLTSARQSRTGDMGCTRSGNDVVRDAKIANGVGEESRFADANRGVHFVTQTAQQVKNVDLCAAEVGAGH
jgi:hypothetical protein